MDSKKLSVYVCALFSLTTAFANAAEPQARFDFPGHSALIFSMSLSKADEKNFGDNWKKATYLSAAGTKIDLLPMEYGDAVFEKGYPPKISPSGEYAVLEVLRIGMLELGPNEKSEPQSREYCPVLNTKTGCVTSMQTGEICGGNWDKKNDTWIVPGDDDADGTNNAMLNYEFPSANVLWKQYVVDGKEPHHLSSLKAALITNLGPTNMMACEPPAAVNREAYTAIARQLRKEGDQADASYIEAKLAQAPHGDQAVPMSSIIVDKAPLYDQPDNTAQTRMYLVKGDRVILLDTTKSDWVLIKYVKKNGTALLKWVQAASLQLPE